MAMELQIHGNEAGGVSEQQKCMTLSISYMVGGGAGIGAGVGRDGMGGWVLYDVVESSGLHILRLLMGVPQYQGGTDAKHPSLCEQLPRVHYCVHTARHCGCCQLA